MKDNLRDAAQAALETLEDVFGKDKIDVSAINNLRAALAEPVVKDSLTVQPSDTPLTDALDAELTDREIDRALDFARTLERERAAAIASIEEERGRAQREGERAIAALAKIAALRNFVDKNMTTEGVREMSDDGEIKAWWAEEIARARPRHRHRLWHLERELAAAKAEIAALRKDAEYADLLRWAESHPEIAYNSITSWWAQAGRGCREREFMFSNCIKGAKRGVD